MTRDRVIVAEDDDDFRLFLVDQLQRNGYEVIPVADGRHLVEHLATAMMTQFRMPVAVVADIRMPGATGIDVTRALTLSTSIPVILMTGFADPRAHEAAANAGAVAVLDKPFSMPRLLALLSRAIARREETPT